MKNLNTKRVRIRIWTFSLAAFVTLGYMICGYSAQTKQYQMELEYGYQRALNDLSDSVSNLETALTKGVYANTSLQQHSIASKLLKDSSSAKIALSQLPLADTQLENVNKFISQVGDFADYLSTSVSRGNKITDAEMDSLISLGGYAKELNQDIKNIQANLNSDNMKVGDTMKVYQVLSDETQNENIPSVNNGFQQINEGFTEIPTLIYDGPFSDHIMQMKPKFLEDKQEVTLEEAINKVQNFLNVSGGELSYNGESGGNLPVYNFSVNNITVSVTKTGGYIDYILNSKAVGAEQFSFNEASQIARQFLNNHGITDMKESYYVTQNGICTINYAFEQDGITCYSDLIKVSVALDNGEVMSFNSSGYIMNHTQRVLPERAIGIEQARDNVSKRLKILNESMAYIPTAGLSEELCYEFSCISDSGDEVLVYINASSGMEEKILILLKSDGGTLVM